MQSVALGKFIGKKYHAAGHTNIAEFRRAISSQLSEENWSKVLNRGKNPNLRIFLKMCSELQCSSNEVYIVLRDAGESQIADAWFNPEPSQRYVEVTDIKPRRLITDYMKKQAVAAIDSAKSRNEKLAALTAATTLLEDEGKLDEVLVAIAKTIGVPRAVAPEDDEYEGNLEDIFKRNQIFEVEPRLTTASNGYDIDEWDSANSPEEANCWGVTFDPHSENVFPVLGTFRSKVKAEAVANKLRELNAILEED